MEHNASASELLAKKSISSNGSEKYFLTFSIDLVSSHLAKIAITLTQEAIGEIQDQTVQLFARKKLDGFAQNETPAEYILDHFKAEIGEKMRHYLLKYRVIHFLYEKTLEQKITLSNYPRLSSTTTDKKGAVTFHFDASLASNIELKEWKNFSFKPPKRKKYKDLDKQVASFLENDLTSPKKATNTNLIESGDWVCFEATLADLSSGKSLHKSLTSNFWIKVKDEEVIDHVKDVFLGKKIHDTFSSTSLERDMVNNEYESYHYNFCITIKAIAKNYPPTLECFKNTFKLKNKIEVHNKLMEIFSYRNDQSQRKAIAEELFHLLLTKHRFEVPKHLIIRRQEDILRTLMQQPDYQVYKSQKDFLEHVELLAEKQLKEEIIIDQIAYKEGIQAGIKDAEQYLYLYNNKRLREFVYFKPLIERLETTNKVINAEILKQTIMREKTLNHIIYTLTH